LYGGSTFVNRFVIRHCVARFTIAERIEIATSPYVDPPDPIARAQDITKEKKSACK
jgi:hypothetical protein